MHPWRGYDLTKRTGLTKELKAALSEEYRNSLSNKVVNAILTGKCAVVDPSIGSSYSLPTIATMSKSRVTSLESIPIPSSLFRSKFTGERLYRIGSYLHERFDGTTFDLLAVELLHHTPQENTVLESFQKLTMAIGAIHASISADHRITVPPWNWQVLRTDSYVKSDVADTKLMCKILVRDAKALVASEGTSK